MIDSEKLLVTLPHLSLGGKEFLGSNLVGSLIVGGNVTQSIDAFGSARGASN